LDNLQQSLIDASQNLQTIRDFIRFMVSTFEEHNLSYGHGTTNPYDEAAYLVLSTLNLPIDTLEPHLDAKLLDHEIKKIIKVCEQRIIHRIPAPYITNEANFLGYKFYVDERVIIPRSYIAEILLNNELSDYIEHPELISNILDLCTGNGSLAIIMADYFSDSQVIAADIDENALEVAEINVNKYDMSAVIELRQSNLFENLTDCPNKFDLIVTNPPYVDAKRMNILPQEYLHEPQISLSGGESGLELVNDILKNAIYFLNDFGILVLEMGDNQEEFEQLYDGLEFTWLTTQNGDGFVFVVTKKALINYFKI
jgi:ribosomal protein L3 glutamine methyltransferase